VFLFFFLFSTSADFLSLPSLSPQRFTLSQQRQTSHLLALTSLVKNSSMRSLLRLLLFVKLVSNVRFLRFLLSFRHQLTLSNRTVRRDASTSKLVMKDTLSSLVQTVGDSSVAWQGSAALAERDAVETAHSAIVQVRRLSLLTLNLS
jgi:hypothetical protein